MLKPQKQKLFSIFEVFKTKALREDNAKGSALKMARPLVTMGSLYSNFRKFKVHVYVSALW